MLLAFEQAKPGDQLTCLPVDSTVFISVSKGNSILLWFVSLYAKRLAKKTRDTLSSTKKQNKNKS